MLAAGRRESQGCGELCRDCGGSRSTFGSCHKVKRKAMAALSEPARIADQLRRAFDGDAWHGPSLLELLADVDAATAEAKPLPDVHSIWELVLHVAAWDGAELRRLSGEKCQPKGAANFPPVTSPTPATWRRAIAEMKRTHQTLVKTVAGLPGPR